MVTGEKLSIKDRFITAGAMFVPVVNGKALREGIGLAADGAEIIARHGDDILDSARAGEKAIDGYETAEKIAKNTDNITDATKGVTNVDVVEVEIPRSKYPESAKHIEDAIANGQPDVLTINRSGVKNNRKASLKGIDKVLGKDLDEYPPAMFKEGGEGASVSPINPSDNRGSGSSTGHKLRPYPDGTKVKYKITDD